MSHNKNKTKNGFTLIEVIIYLALFAIFIGGTMTAVYSMFESGNRNTTKLLVQEEGDFFLSKIEWVLTGAKTIDPPGIPTPPLTENSSSNISVAKFDGTSISIKLFGTDLQLQDSTGIYTLNSSNIRVKNLLFTHKNIYATNTNAPSVESIEVSFTLYATTPNGMDIQQDFSTIKYIKK